MKERQKRDSAEQRGGTTGNNPTGNNHNTLCIVSAAALVDEQGRILVARRACGKPMAGRWEFPGGKVEHGETPEIALIRELKEELDIETSNRCLTPVGFSSHGYKDFHVVLTLYVCRVWKGVPLAREGQQLKWVSPSKMHQLAMLEANIPLIASLEKI